MPIRPFSVTISDIHEAAVACDIAASEDIKAADRLLPGELTERTVLRDRVKQNMMLRYALLHLARTAEAVGVDSVRIRV